MANKTYLEDEDLLKQYYSRYGGYWRFPEVLDFCYLVNPYFRKSALLNEMEVNFRTLVGEYPSGMGVNSKLASECWNIKQEYVIPGNGAAELIKVLMESLEGTVGVTRPTFEEYPNRVSEDRVIVFIPQDENFRYLADDLIAYFSQHSVENLLLINPDNPSGNFIPIDGIKMLAQWCEDNRVRLILDESFVDFADDWRKSSMISDDILETYPHMCVIKSISKSYGVPGLRLGILCSADTDLIAKLKKKVSIWNICSFAEFFMQIYPKYREEYYRACDKFLEARNLLIKEMNEIPYLHVMPTQANFIFAEVLSPFTSKSLATALLKDHQVLASACLAKKGIEKNKYMRFAIRSIEDNERLIQALNSLV